MFAKKEMVVVFAKFFRQADDVLVRFSVVVVVVAGRAKRRGLEQQPWEHTCSTSLKQGDCIAAIKIDDELNRG